MLTVLEQVSHLDIPAHATVVDIGSGDGRYAFAISENPGFDGIVYALDVHSDAVDHIASRAPDNVIALWGDGERPRQTHLADHCADVVVLAHVVDQIEHRTSLVQEIKRILKISGKVIVIEHEREEYIETMFELEGFSGDIVTEQLGFVAFEFIPQLS